MTILVSETSKLNKYLIFYNSLIWSGAGRSDALGSLLVDISLIKNINQ